MVLRKVSARLLAWGLAALAGGWAVALARSGSEDRPELFESEFTWHHEPDSVLRITESKHLPLPQLLGDFDLLATVELSEDSELDLVFRRVEPRIRRLGEDEGVPLPGGARLSGEFLQFHGRFSLVRLSTRQEAPPYRSREEALFGDELDGGVRLRAGVPASLQLEARGRWVRVNVAGRWLTWMETTDDHGSLAFVARGGTALVHYLTVRPRPRGFDPPAWLLGALLSSLVGLFLTCRGAAVLRAVVSIAVALPLGGWLAHELLFSHLVVGARPSTLGLLVGALAMLPLATGLAWRRPRRWLVVAGIALVPVLLEVAARLERGRLAPLEDPRLSLYFGSDSGVAPFDAFARRLHSASRVHTLAGPKTRVVFLGGAAMFEARPDLAEHVGLRTSIALGQKLGRAVEGVVAPTVFGHTLQQLLLFRRFYLDYRPQVVVFGVTRFESAAGEIMRARELFEATRPVPPGSGPSALWELHRRLATGDQPLATPADLEQNLTDMAALCREHGIALVLATEPGIDPAMLAVMEDFARARSVPLVRDVLTETGEPRIDELVRVVAAQL